MTIHHTDTGDYYIWDSDTEIITLGFLVLAHWELRDWCFWYQDESQVYIRCPWVFYSRLRIRGK